MSLCVGADELEDVELDEDELDEDELEDVELEDVGLAGAGKGMLTPGMPPVHAPPDAKGLSSCAKKDMISIRNYFSIFYIQKYL